MSKNSENNDQKIRCTVTECLHNCIQDSTCRLEKIMVCPCSTKLDDDKSLPRDNTSCASYKNCGDLNVVEITGRD